MDLDTTVTPEEFVAAAIKFSEISTSLSDGWRLYLDEDCKHKSYIIKNTFLSHGQTLCKAEFVIFYNLSYGIPAFSFNIWNSSGVLLTLDEIREMSFLEIKKEDFYSIITQQEHPLFCRPYFVMHPCHTAAHLEKFKKSSKNIIVTFLGLITPLLKIHLHLEYGL